MMITDTSKEKDAGHNSRGESFPMRRTVLSPVEAGTLVSAAANPRPLSPVDVPVRETAPCVVSGCTGVGKYRCNGVVACSLECLEQLLRGAVVEEQAIATAAELRTTPRVQLGQILVGQGTITEADLEQALRSQRATGAGRLGCWLKQQVDLSEAEFTAALSIQWHCPVFRMGSFVPARMVGYLPRPLVEEYGALPLRVTGTPQRLTLCFEDRVDHGLVAALERIHGLPVDAGLLTATEFWEVTRDLLSVHFPSMVAVEAPSIECMTEAIAQFLVDSGAEDARLVAVHGLFWLRVVIAPENTPVHSSGRVFDVLCSIVAARPGFEPPPSAADVKLLARQMLRQLI